MSLKMFIKILLLIITSVLITMVDGGCEVSFNSMECRYDVSCTDVIDDDEIWKFSHRGSDCITVYYNGNNFYQVHLKINYPFYPEDSQFYYIVTSLDLRRRRLDLSDNSINLFPTLLETFINLKHLTLSNNNITIVQFTKLRTTVESLNLSKNDIVTIEAATSDLSLKQVDLSYNKLTNISKCFSHLVKLENLDLSYNQIDYLSPMTFDGISTLKVLNLQNNAISDINTSLYRFNDLKVLNLKHNKITILRSYDLEMLNELEYLDLSFNRLTKIDDFFSHNVKLQTLHLNHNILSDFWNDTVIPTDLTLLNLSDNNIKKLHIGVFRNTKIKSFSIARNNLEGELEKGMFEGLVENVDLDLSNQSIAGLGDYAFNGLLNLQILLLRYNRIEKVSTKCFLTLKNLKIMDLSFNNITELGFKTDDLHKLEWCSLKNNKLATIKYEDFSGLFSLQFLDVSNNNIAQIGEQSFQSLNNLIKFELSNNPIAGILKNDTFSGLSLLPALEISNSLVTVVQNGSLGGMTQLSYLNMSRSKINTLEYNAFLFTSSIETLDLSYNELQYFGVNSSDFAVLKSLYLNNNLIKSFTFAGFYHLSYVQLSYNKLAALDNNIFIDQNLQFLDISFNKELVFNPALLINMSALNNLCMSNTKEIYSFENINIRSLTKLTAAHLQVRNITNLKLNVFKDLDDLNLSFNNITGIDKASLANLTDLVSLDLSNNKISFVQRGAFKDNVKLNFLNLSHNAIKEITYGMFRGLVVLKTLDISYNSIRSIGNERFIDVANLETLIVDYNMIESITPEEFRRTEISKISIGGNPIPCGLLIDFTHSSRRIQITSIHIDEHNNDNFNGIICNSKMYDANIHNRVSPSDTDILINIRDLLIDKLNLPHETGQDNVGEKSLSEITNNIESIKNYIEKLSDILSNSSNQNTIQSSLLRTNIILEKMLKEFTIKSSLPAAPVVTDKNATYENLLEYINKIKQNMEENLSQEKNNIIYEIENKVSSLKSHINESVARDENRYEAMKTESLEAKLTLVETCVGLMLCLMLGFVLYLIYKSGIFFKKRSMSISTRELPSAMDSPL